MQGGSNAKFAEVMSSLTSMLPQPNTTKTSSSVSVLLAYILDAIIMQQWSTLHASASQALELLQLDDSSDAVVLPATKSAETSRSARTGTGPQQFADCIQPTGCASRGQADVCMNVETCVSLTSKLLLPLADRGATERLHCQHALQGLLPCLRGAVDIDDEVMQQLLHKCDEIVAGALG